MQISLYLRLRLFKKNLRIKKDQEKNTTRNLGPLPNIEFSTSVLKWKLRGKTLPICLIGIFQNKSKYWNN